MCGYRVLARSPSILIYFITASKHFTTVFLILPMALKWPIMCWCAIKKLLTHLIFPITVKVRSFLNFGKLSPRSHPKNTAYGERPLCSAPATVTACCRQRCTKGSDHPATTRLAGEISTNWTRKFWSSGYIQACRGYGYRSSSSSSS